MDSAPVKEKVPGTVHNRPSYTGNTDGCYTPNQPPQKEEPLLEEQAFPQESTSALINLFSSSLMDLVVLNSTLPIPEHFKSYQDLLERMAFVISIQAKLMQENIYKLLDILQEIAPRRIALLISQALLEPAKAI